MAEIRYSRNLFLRCINVIYLFAFTSFYIQIPGLYGENGILPARTQMDIKETDFAAKLQKKPTLLWFASYLGLDTEHMMDVLALLGMFLSFSGFVSQKCCTKPIFAALWSLYYSLYQVGQTFMWFQWDIMLLETGFLCILLSPWRQKGGSASSGGGSKKQTASSNASSPADYINFWLVRWLLFRFMFSTGVVKLSSGCPTWWGLTALSVHFESMVIPTPLAWYFYHLPWWLLKLGLVFSFFAEIFVSPLFFCPIKGVRTTAFFIQVFLQLALIVSGNYNFFNFLTIALCLSLLDDDFFYGEGKKSSALKRFSKYLATIVIYAAVIFALIKLYGVKLTPAGIIEFKINFKPTEFDVSLGRAVPILAAVAFCSLAFTCLRSLALVFSQTGSTVSKVFSFCSTLFYIFTAIALFSDSLVPFSNLHPATANTTVHPEIRLFHNKLSHLHLTNSYGLWRRMSGVGGRPEVIIEGANNVEGPWLEYHFKYKPGDVNSTLPIVAPHTPRLDWQMWFAALGTYHQNSWIMSLTYRLLTGSKEVLALMDAQRNPFPLKPPRYITASLYHYSYTPWEARDKPATWTRKKVGEYFPIFSKEHPPLLDYLRNLKILQDDKKKKSQLSTIFIEYLNGVRSAFAVMEPTYLLLSLVMTSIAIIMFGSLSPASSGQSKQQQQKSKKKNK
uniref:Lipase maturation factor n=1 Tax=Panstrongylus lignarius TaxID=156445 RepID=A0A224X8N7_9HEMI